MKGNLNIIGMGMGYSTLTIQSLCAIDESSILIFTSKRLLNSYKKGINKEIKSEVFVSYKEDEINEILKKREMGNNISIIISGDVGFYSFASHYKLSDAIFYPGISSFSALAAHFHLDYSTLSFVSIHGRDERRAISKIRRNKYSFILLPKSINSFVELLKLYDWGDLTAYLGSDIGGENESFCKCQVKDLIDGDNYPLKSLIIENPNYDSRVRTGIKDDFFIRENKIPMSKRAVRSMVLSTLDLKPTDVVWDIGCGSGSVSVEAGLSVYDGWVCAVDVKEEAVKLTEKNLIKAKIANYELTINSAPNGLDDFKNPNAVFIGGSNGNIDEIIECARKRNPDVKIVMTAISLDTLSSALALPIDWDIIQVQSSLSRKIGKHHMMSAENPIYILSTGGLNE
jgi:precorrin-6Y C5,15-methyltransferase (decarboxylating)